MLLHPWSLHAVPQTMFWSGVSVPQTMLLHPWSLQAVPQTMFWLSSVFATPQLVPRLNALAVGRGTPPPSMWLPQMMCLFHIAWV